MSKMKWLISLILKLLNNMRRFLILFPDTNISSIIIQRIQTLEYFELFPTVYAVRSERFDTSQALFDFLQHQISPMPRLVVVSVNNNDYWGYANREFWPWMSDGSRQ